MWTANAATVAPSTDTADGRLHLTPANLGAMFHRALEAPTTHRVLARIFDDPDRFTVHAPLPAGEAFADEGAANHLRLWLPGRPAMHLFGWGRGVQNDGLGPTRHPARQTLQASQAVARLHQLPPEQCLFPRQSAAGIDAGAFHSDVLAVANQGLLLLHERAFTDLPGLLDTLRARLGEGFTAVVATEKELPLADAVAAYPFNSQVLTLPSGAMALVAPAECSQAPRVQAFLERVVATTPVAAVHHLDLRQSMQNGGGPACLRLRIWLDDREVAAVRAGGARVFLDEPLAGQLEDWVTRHYRDRLTGDDLADPALVREVMTALDELTGLLGLGAIYDFQS
jgi:succinylarginine dihydrolase